MKHCIEETRFEESVVGRKIKTLEILECGVRCSERIKKYFLKALKRCHAIKIFLFNNELNVQEL